MKKIFILCLSCLAICIQAATAQPGNTLHETAKTFMRSGDYGNAVLILNRSLAEDPKNTAVAKDLALSYYYQKDNAKALETIKSVLDRDDADDQSYQIAGNIYKALDQTKECEKMYKKGIKRFPESGPLYNELGELQLADKNYDAIKTWEKGIELDPGYARTYYSAAKYYFYTTDKVWSIIYGEMFINMEPTGRNTAEMKQLLLDSYKKLFTEANLEQNNKDKSLFVKQYLHVMNNQTSVASAGLNVESLSMIRTRFILDWFADKDVKIPFRLFNYHSQLLKEGMFEAYNQWLFGAAENLGAYQNWLSTHAAENNDFMTLQKGRIFKVPAGEYYHEK